MDFLNELKMAPNIRPMFNIGCLFDIPTGRYIAGKYGESILNGGLAHITGVCGRGNSYKTSLMMYMMLTVMDRVKESAAMQYDTEMSMSMQRIQDLSDHICHDSLMGAQMDESFARLRLTDKTVYNGSEWYDWLKSAARGREKATKSHYGTTPFIDAEGKPIEVLHPFLVGVDSLSQFSSANVLKIQDDGNIGDSTRNIEAMRDAGAKTQMLMELPTVTARSGVYILMSAHMGDDIAMDPYAPPQKKLAFLKNKLKLKNVPEKFTFLVNNCWHVASTTVLANQTTKAPEFPRPGADDMKGDPDLQLLSIINLRGKYGLTGLPIEVIVSQSEGVMVGLTEFYYLKTFGRYGISGNDRSYALDLCPDISLSRTTIRGKIDEHAKLRRALQITSEMCQMKNLWHETSENPGFCTPKELYDDLKAKGYDWDQLLNTRGYWTFDNDKHPVPFLSTMDLLNMRLGAYRPYWM